MKIRELLAVWILVFLLTVSIILAVVSILLGGAPAAHADPLPCATAGVCQYMPNPSYNGPLMPTWDTPGYYGGVTNGPVQCNVTSAACAGVETEQSPE